jgi:hypothetical protein
MNKLIALAAMPIAICLVMGCAKAANTSSLCKKFSNSLYRKPDGTIHSTFRIQNWEPLTINVHSAHISNPDFLTIGAEGTLFDIENRGIKDRVLRVGEMMMGTDQYDNLYVLRSDPFGTNNEITIKSFGEIADNGLAIDNLYGYFAPLSRYGIRVPDLSLLTIGNKHYVMIAQDTVPRLPPALVVLATYSGSLDNKHAMGNRSVHGSGRLKVICAVP